MHLVIDAMNVIGSRPDGWWRDRAGAIERFVAAVERWAAEETGRVTVMLEHEPRRPLATGRARAGGRVEVAWASGGGRDAADREILARLPAWLEDDEVTVVSSDRDLAAEARAAGAAVTPSRAFRAALEEAL